MEAENHDDLNEIKSLDVLLDQTNIKSISHLKKVFEQASRLETKVQQEHVHWLIAIKIELYLRVSKEREKQNEVKPDSI